MSDETLCVLPHGTQSNGEKRFATANYGRLCHNHANKLESWLRDVVVDFALLPMQLAPMKSSTDYSSDGRGSSDEAAAPLNLGVAALTDTERGGAPRARGDELWYELPDIPSVLATLHGRAEDVRCILDPTHDHDDNLRGRSVVSEVNYLIAAFDTLCDTDWVDEVFTEVKGLWIALQRAHQRPQPRAMGKCLNLDCDGTVWPREHSSPWCSTCHRIYDTNAEIIKVRLEAENQKAQAG
jgi:hypothetical protein